MSRSSGLEMEVSQVSQYTEAKTLVYGKNNVAVQTVSGYCGLGFQEGNEGKEAGSWLLCSYSTSSRGWGGMCVCVMCSVHLDVL